MSGTLVGFPRRRDPFIIDELLQIPDTLNDNIDHWESFRWKEDAQHTTDQLLEIKKLTLPSLDLSFFQLDEQDGHLPDLESSGTASTTSTPDNVLSLQSSDDLDEHFTDIWAFSTQGLDASRKSSLISWDAFTCSTPRIIRARYLSEQPVQYTNAVLSQIRQVETDAPVFLKKEFFISALSQLGLGRTSSLFNYDSLTEQSKSYLQQIGQTGLSCGLVDQIICDFQDWGHQWWALRSFLKHSRVKAPSAIGIAFESALGTVLHGLEKRLLNCYFGSQSVLQLHHNYQNLASLLYCLTRVLPQPDVKNGDKALLLNLTEEVGSTKANESWTKQIMMEVLRLCAQPLLLQAAEATGLAHLPISTKGQLHLNDFDSIFSAGTLDLIEICRESLDILRNHRPDHPTLVPFWDNTKPLPLSWETTWEGIELRRKEAREYEQWVRERLDDSFPGKSKQVLSSGYLGGWTNESSKETLVDGQNLPSLDWDDQQFASSGFVVPLENKTLFNLASQERDVESGKENIEDSFEPPLLIALASSLHPILSAQSAAVNHACLRLIFNGPGLRFHIQQQWQYHFLMDSALRSRLCEALFDSGRKYGIPLPNNEVLPSDFSFGIDDIGNDELEAGSIEIVDLLRLHYQPPPALRYVFTEQALQLYHHIFKANLQILRLQHLTQTLVRLSSHKSVAEHGPASQRKFRIEAHRFVCALSDYVANFAIGMPFQELETFLLDTEKLVDKHSLNGRKIQDVRNVHESTLSRICDDMFLGKDKQQRQLQKTLQTLYRSILDEDIQYPEWKHRVAEFVGLLKARDTTSSQYLALKIDMNGYYG